MPKTKISEFSATPASNTDIDSIFIGEGMAPSNVNDAIRELMAQLKDFQVGSAGDPVTVGGVLTVQAGSASTPALTTAGDTNTGMFFPAADTIAFSEGGAEVARFDSSGNLGLGVTPSAWDTVVPAFQIGGAGGYIAAQGSAEVLRIGSNNYYGSSAFRYVINGNASRYDQTGGSHSWHTAPSGTAGNAITFTQAMTLDASGRLLVGTTSASGTDSDNRIIALYGAGTANRAQLRLMNSNTGTSGSDGTSFSVGSDLNLYITQYESAGIVFETGGANQRAQIDSSGNLLIGTTSSSAGGVTVRTHIAGSNFGLGISVPSSGDQQNIRFVNGTTAVGSVTTTGSATNYNVVSDQRLKENIVDAPELGSVIDSIKVRSYDWKTDQTHQRAGFVAQELVTVAPEAVHQPEDSEQMMAVDYSKLVPMLVKEIQSLRKRLADAGI
jgi:hypothetical protein